MNPSTRPVVRSRPYQQVEDEPFEQEVFDGGAIAPTEHVDHEFQIGAPADVWRTTLDWPTPDDLDLEVYRKEAGGELTEVGSSGNLPGQKEQVEITGAGPGTYVLRVINYASATPSYTLTAALFDSVTRHTEGKPESYRLTCEKKGRVCSSPRGSSSTAAR